MIRVTKPFLERFVKKHDKQLLQADQTQQQFLY